MQLDLLAAGKIWTARGKKAEELVHALWRTYFENKQFRQ